MSAIDQDFVRDLIERHSDASGGNGRDFHNGAYARMADEIEQAIAATLGPCSDSCNCTNGERTDLAAENAALREQMERLVTLLRNDCDIDASWDGLRRFWSIGLTEDGCLMRDRACKAEAENARLRAARDTWAENDARLRELVRFIMHQCNDGNPRCDECIGWNDGECVALLRMREMGMGAYDG